MTNAEDHHLKDRTELEDQIKKWIDQLRNYNRKKINLIEGAVLELMNQEKKLKNAKRKSVHK